MRILCAHLASPQPFKLPNLKGTAPAAAGAGSGCHWHWQQTAEPAQPGHCQCASGPGARCYWQWQSPATRSPRPGGGGPLPVTRRSLLRLRRGPGPRRPRAGGAHWHGAAPGDSEPTRSQAPHRARLRLALAEAASGSRHCKWQAGAQPNHARRGDPRAVCLWPRAGRAGLTGG